MLGSVATFEVEVDRTAKREDSSTNTGAHL